MVPCGKALACNRSKQSPAHHLHMFWMCPRLTSFWSDLFRTLKQDLMVYLMVQWLGFPGFDSWSGNVILIRLISANMVSHDRFASECRFAPITYVSKCTDNIQRSINAFLMFGSCCSGPASCYRKPLVRFPWSACQSVIGQDTESQTVSYFGQKCLLIALKYNTKANCSVGLTSSNHHQLLPHLWLCPPNPETGCCHPHPQKTRPGS